MDTMIQRCPKCGTWLKTDKKGVFGRFSRAFEDTIDDSAVIGRQMGAVMGEAMGKLGEAAGAGAGVYIGYVNGAIEAFLGDNFVFKCPECGNSWGTDDEEDDQTEDYLEWEALQERISEYNEQIELFRDQVIEHKVNKTRLSISEIQKIKTIIPKLQQDGCLVQEAILNDNLAIAYDINGEKDEAIKTIDKSLEIYDDANSHIIKGMVLGKGVNSTYTKKAIDELMYFYAEERQRNIYFSDMEIKDRILTLFDVYASSLSDLQLCQRRYLIFTEEVTKLSNKVCILPFNLKEYPFHFPSGHPRPNILYVAHPFRKDSYIPFNNYEFELFKDEVDEFRWIMENLGAKSIIYADSQDKKNSEENAHSKNIGGKIDCIQASIGVDYEQNENRGQYIELKKKFQESSNFNLGVRPNIPDNLVWYNHRIDWQRKCESRLSGRLVSFCQNISNEESSSITEQERIALEAELNTIFKASINTDNSIVLKRESRQSWDITVEFYPLSEYMNSDSNSEDAGSAHLLDIKPTSSNKSMIWIVCGIIFMILATVIYFLT